MSTPELGPVAHPGADFHVTDEPRRALFVLTDGSVLDGEELVDVPIIGEVDGDGRVRWGGGR